MKNFLQRLYRASINIFKFFLKFLGTTLLYLTIFSIITYMVFNFTIEKYMEYKEEIITEYNVDAFNYKPNLKTEIYSKDGVLLTEIYDENRIYTPYNRIPKELVDSLLSVEDRRFLNHHGVDAFGIGRAIISNLKSGNLAGQGASTITQQLTRHLFLSQDKTWERKVKEIILAMELEKKYDKTKIIEMYLNEVYFGHNAYGIEAASQTYFGKTLSELKTDEIALLVGLPQAPSAYDPYKNLEKAKKRRLAVLDCMYKANLITLEQAKEISLKEIILVTDKDEKEGANKVDKFPYLTSWFKSELKRVYGDKIFSSGWKIYTTIDSKAQKLIEKIATEQSLKYENLYSMYDIAIVSINPQTGELIAMTGGQNFSENQVNMAVRPRQPGSSMKPYVYATGIENGVLTDSSIFLDEPTNFGGYKPFNYDHQNRGFMTTREALKISNNIVAIKAGQMVGTANIIDFCKKLGITTLSDTKDNVLGMSIGGLSQGISPYQMATAYGVFANDGILVSPNFIAKIENNEKEVIYSNQTNGLQVIKKDTANLITDMLRDVVNSGTGSTAKINIDMAGKTGTTNSSRDLWFVGYTPNVSTAVWIGNSNNSKPKNNPSSAKTAAYTWKLFMSEYTSKIENQNFGYTFPKTTVRLYLSKNEEPMKAGEFCINNPLEETIPEYKRDYIVKDILLQTKYIPKKTKTCQPINESEYLQQFINEKGLNKLIELNYTQKLIEMGYIHELVQLGYLDLLVEQGFIQELKNNGYEKELIEQGFTENNSIENTVQNETY